MGIEYDCLNEDPHQRAIDLVNIIDHDVDEIISLMDDIIDTIIYFSGIDDEHQFIFWSEVHRHIIRHHVITPSPDHMFI